MPPESEPRSTPREPDRARRSDARQNTERLLAAAKELFDEHGPDIALDEVARHAGVGNATLYRNFPSRSDLLVAVYSDEVDALCQHGEVLLDEPDSGQALFDWLDSFVEHVESKRTLAMAATQAHTALRSELFERWHESMTGTASRLLARAQESGAIRSDLTANDLLALANAVALTSASTDRAQRLLEYLFEGIEISGD